MNQKYAIRLLGGAAVVAAAGAALFAVSATAHGLETPVLETVLTAPPQPSDTRILLAQADAAPSSAPVSSAPVSSAPAPATTPVSYSEDQAARGEKKFEDQCVECHGDDLKGGLNGGPPLRGLAFEEKYANGAPASALFGFMSSAMPPQSPGRFSAETYADLMAYVLKRNGFKEGAPLPSDLDALDMLTMEK